MNRTLAQALSVFFHPLLLPTYLFCLVLYLLPTSVVTLPTDSRWMILALVFFTTFVIPGLGTYFLYRHGYVSNLQVENRSERALPFFFTAVCFSVTTYLFYSETYFDRLFFVLMALITLSVFLTFVFSFWFKISAHAVGSGGALSILMLLNSQLPDNDLLYVLAATIVVVGLVLSARLALDAHTPVEVYTGFLLGSAVSFGALLVMG